MEKELALVGGYAAAAFVIAMLVFIATAAILGVEKAIRLPGGALSVGMSLGFSAWPYSRYAIIFTIIAAILGHIVMVKLNAKPY